MSHHGNGYDSVFGASDWVNGRRQPYVKVDEIASLYGEGGAVSNDDAVILSSLAGELNLSRVGHGRLQGLGRAPGDSSEWPDRSRHHIGR